MVPLFIALSLLNLLSLAVTMALGYFAPPAQRGMHILAGALSALVCVGVHCVVFTYFIATAKWMAHAIAVKRLEPSLAAPTRSFRRQAFPAALAGMGSVFFAAILGAARDNGMAPAAWHHGVAIVAVLINLLVAWAEYRAIVCNGRLIDQILARINASSDAVATPAARLTPASVAANMRS
jgi:hypothetical protein